MKTLCNYLAIFFSIACAISIICFLFLCHAERWKACYVAVIIGGITLALAVFCRLLVVLHGPDTTNSLDDVAGLGDWS